MKDWILIIFLFFVMFFIFLWDQSQASPEQEDDRCDDVIITQPIGS